MRFKYFLTIARPANVITSIADILAGIAIAYSFSERSNSFSFGNIVLLILATSGLYAGGIIFNDVFDIEEDKINRPERLIPSGKVSLKEAKVFGVTLFIIALISSLLIGLTSLYVAIGVIVMILIYNSIGKKSKVFGPITMGLCRSGNLLLGASIIPYCIIDVWIVALVPLLFISGVTLTAQGEAIGNNRLSISLAIFIDTITVVTLLLICTYFDGSYVYLIPFIVTWFGVNLYFKVIAIRENTPSKIMKAVKMGVLSIIILDACYAASFGNIEIAIGLILLLPLSIITAKKFHVT